MATEISSSTPHVHITLDLKGEQLKRTVDLVKAAVHKLRESRAAAGMIVLLLHAHWIVLVRAMPDICGTRTDCFCLCIFSPHRLLNTVGQI